MLSRKSILLLCLLVIALGQPVSARTWRPSGQAPLKGEFEDVVGGNVLIRTDDGVKTVAYADLTLTDKAVVKSKLVALDREPQALLLDQGAVSPRESISSPGSSLPGRTIPEPGGSRKDELTRTWTDVAGNRIVAEFVSVQGTIVILRIDGNVQQYPIKGFCGADQTWIADHQKQVSPQTPPERPSHGISLTPPVIPIQAPVEPFLPPVDTPHISGGDFSGIETPADGDSESDNLPPSGIQNSIPSNYAPSPASDGLAGHSSGNGNEVRYETETVYRCEHCGAEFAHDSDVKTGDDCPKCSGGSSYSGSWIRSIRFSRGLFKLVIFLVVCTGSGIVWLVRQITGSES